MKTLLLTFCDENKNEPVLFVPEKKEHVLSKFNVSMHFKSSRELTDSCGYVLA